MYPSLRYEFWSDAYTSQELIRDIPSATSGSILLVAPRAHIIEKRSGIPGFLTLLEHSPHVFLSQLMTEVMLKAMVISGTITANETPTLSAVSTIPNLEVAGTYTDTSRCILTARSLCRSFLGIPGRSRRRKLPWMTKGAAISTKLIFLNSEIG